MARTKGAGKGSNVGNVYVTVVPTMRGFKQEMDRQLSIAGFTKTGHTIGEKLGDGIVASLSDKLVSGGSALQGFGRSLADVGGKLTTGITTPLATATAGLGAFALSTASAAETTEMSFTTMLGSAEAARDMMEELADFAAHTPFELSGLQTATRQLLAYGFTAEDVIPMLTAVGDATAALGTGQAGIEAVTRALGQMQAKGKVQAEEMLQLTEQGIPAWQMLADTLGTDVAEAQQMVTDGAVDSARAIDALISGMEARYGGLMEAQSQTLTGLASNLVDALTQPLMELRDRDAYASIADGLERVVDAAGPFVESLLPHMERGLEIVADVLDGAADAMESFSDMSEEGQSQLIGLVAQAALAGPALTVMGRGIQGLGTLMRGAGGAIRTGTTLVGKLSEGLLDLATFPKTAETAIGRLAGTLSGAAGPISLVASLVGTAAVAAFADWAAKTAEAEEHQRLLESATRDASEIMGDARDAAYGLGDAIGSIEPDVDSVLNKLADINDSVSDAFTDLYVDDAKLGQYVSVIDDLANKSDLSATQQYRLAEAVEGFNDIVGTQYEVVDAVNGAIADQDGVIQSNTDQLHENADAWRDRATAQAYQNVATQYMEAEAEALYNLQVAQDNLADSRKRLNDLQSQQDEIGKRMTGVADQSSDEYQRLADRYAELGGQIQSARADVDEYSQSVGELSDAYETAATNSEQFGDWAAINAADASEATKASAMSISDSLNGMGDSFEAALSGMGYDLNDLSLRLADAGVSSAELEEIGSRSLQGLADSCEGDVDRMVWAIDNWNNVPIIEKDGTVRIEDSQLIDSQGRVYTWNGTALVDKDGNVAVQDQELVDAQGRVYTWNDGHLESMSGTASIDGNLGDAIAMRDNWNNGFLATKYGLASIRQVYTTVHDPGRSYNAAGGIRPHADGAIVTRATPLDVVGEAGAEAIVPLTNRRYSQPFVDLIAEGVTRKSDSAEVVAAINALRRDISEVGVYLDSGRLVGGISRDMNRTLGRIQKRGSLA